MIIPGINCRTFEEAVSAAKKISEFSEWAHLDVEDGIFTPNSTWSSLNEFAQLAEELPRLHFEAHLMVINPEEVIESWLKAGIERVIVHLEAMSNAELALETAKRVGGEVMLSIVPDTPVEKTEPYLNPSAGGFSNFQVLAVSPGPSDQRFDERVFEKIRFLREKAPNAIIEVDGGINPEIARMAKEAGADILVSTSYIMNSPDPASAFHALEEV